MPISEFYRAIRERVGTTLLLMPAVAAVIRDREGRILLQQQHDETWSLPAGAVEPGESPSAAVEREVVEETGLIVHAETILAVVGGEQCRVRYANRDEVEYVVTVFACTVVGGVLIASNDETKRLKYFAATGMPKLAFSFPAQVFEEGRSSAFFVDSARTK